MVCVRGLDSDILVVSENGYGKRSAVEDYRITNRGGKGVKTLSVTEKTGSLISILNVTDEDDLMIINRSASPSEPVSKNAGHGPSDTRGEADFTARRRSNRIVCRVPRATMKKSWLKERSPPPIPKARRKRRVNHILCVSIVALLLRPE